MDWYGRFSMALTAGYQVFRRVYNEPGVFSYKERYTSWQDRYALLWSYYISSALNDMGKWAAYRAQHRLYRYTRGVYNPTRRLVDFYAGTIYPGILTADARRFEDGTIIAIPFSDDTPRKLTKSISVLWKWSNWQINKNIMVRYAAAVGECLVEIVDDLEKKKVTFQIRYPSTVTHLLLDFRGNVKEYAIEYDYEEPGDDEFAPGQTHKFKKVVNESTIRYYRDDVPYAYDGIASAYPNPYGFVPAVWVRHTDIGTDHGEPCMRNMDKWDELNALASHLFDQQHKVLEAPILISGENIQQFKEDLPEGAQSDGKRPDAGRGNIPIIRGSLGARMDTTQLNTGEGFNAIDHLIAEIERDHPELTMHREMRKMSQVTGPAVTRLFGDVEIMVQEARNSYDTQSVKLFQMGVAIAGWRLENGDWGDDDELTDDQRAFDGYNLESYNRGDLDMEIADRPLVPLGRYETIQSERAEVALEREKQMAALGPESGEPSGEMANQIGMRLRMRSATEGVTQTERPPSA